MNWWTDEVIAIGILVGFFAGAWVTIKIQQEIEYRRALRRAQARFNLIVQRGEARIERALRRLRAENEREG